LIALLAALLVACGGAPAPTAPAEPTSAPTSAGAAAFPVTIEHAFGSTTVPAAPQRVATIGFNEADFALALGVVPVGVRDFIGEYAE
jgi:iron complex transport system substrate-binding protein